MPRSHSVIRGERRRGERRLEAERADRVRVTVLAPGSDRSVVMVVTPQRRGELERDGYTVTDVTDAA